MRIKADCGRYFEDTEVQEAFETLISKGFTPQDYARAWATCSKSYIVKSAYISKKPACLNAEKVEG